MAEVLGKGMAIRTSVMPSLDVTRRHASQEPLQILVQLPGVTDVEQAKRVIKTTAQLALKIVEDSAPTQEAQLKGNADK